MIRRKRLQKNQRDSQFLVDPEVSTAFETRGLVLPYRRSTPFSQDNDRSLAEKALVRRTDLEQQVHQIQEEMEKLQRSATRFNTPASMANRASTQDVQVHGAEQIDVLHAHVRELESQQEFIKYAARVWTI
ncbi:hypothetical protein C8R44DRAFT_725259 [Mycena epipterygia]|nr:hypothetical protein C8R44DRAFT_725259 [Mycena epipterygia]